MKRKKTKMKLHPSCPMVPTGLYCIKTLEPVVLLRRASSHSCPHDYQGCSQLPRFKIHTWMQYGLLGTPQQLDFYRDFLYQDSNLLPDTSFQNMINRSWYVWLSAWWITCLLRRVCVVWCCNLKCKQFDFQTWLTPWQHNQVFDCLGINPIACSFNM